MKPFKWLALSVAALVLLIAGLWLIALPESLILNLIESERGDIKAEVEGFRKGFFYSFKADSITLERIAEGSGQKVLVIENAEGSINPFSVFLLRLTMKFGGDVAGGRLEGKVNLLRKGMDALVEVSGADIGGMPFLESFGIDASGSLSGLLTYKNGTGEAKFSIDGADFKTITVSGVNAPLDMFKSAQGALEINSGVLNIVSFTLSGDDIYARLKGDVKGGALDLKLELMPEAGFRDKILLLPFEGYLVSPGYYVIPLKGDIAKGI